MKFVYWHSTYKLSVLNRCLNITCDKSRNLCVYAWPTIGLKIGIFGLRVSGFRFQVSGFRIQVSGLRFQVSGFRFQVSSLIKTGGDEIRGDEGVKGGGIRFQVSGLRFQVSGFRFHR